MKRREFFLNRLAEIEQDHKGLINIYKKFQGFLAETGRDQKATEINAKILKLKIIQNSIRNSRTALIEKQRELFPDKEQEIFWYSTDAPKYTNTRKEDKQGKMY
jgi:hypothetical protein